MNLNTRGTPRFLPALLTLLALSGGCGGDSSAPSAPVPTTPGPTPVPEPVPEPAPTCQVGMVLRPGESCTYPGAPDALTINPDGTASFLFVTSGSAINVTSGNVSLQATRQSDGSWLISRVGASGGGEGATTFREGDRIPGFPTGPPSVVSGGSFSISGGVVTITLRRDGYAEYPAHRYTCDASECGIRGSLVTAGVIVRTATERGGTAGLAPATQAEFEARVVGRQVAQGAFRLIFIAPGRIREIDDGTPYEGDYEYRRTGSNSGMIVYTYDVTGNDPNRERSEVRFAFRTETSGTYEYSYFEGGTRSGSSSGSFEFETAPTGSTNRAPRAVGSISDQTLAEDGSATTVNVAARFSDPDGDNLSYRASSSRTSVVRTSVSGSRVTLTPGDAGTATVTVTATDPGGLSATQRFTVTVTAAPGGGGAATFREGDRIPDFPTGIPNTVRGGSASSSGGVTTITLRRGGYVEYPEHRYTCDASECGIRGGLVTAGVIVRTATGEGGGGGTANRAPRAVGSLSDQTLTEDGSARTVNVSARFSDPDGDTLGYRASSSRTSVVRTSVSGSRVTLTPRDAGTATVTVTATDPGGLSATQRFTVTVTAAPGGGGAATFREGDRIPDFPTGIPNTVSRGSFLISGGVVTITLQRNGYAEYPEHRYTCDASACGIRGGLVTAGVIVRTASGEGGGGGTANRAPRAVGSLSDQRLTEDGSATTVNVSARFSDPDGDTLGYRASSSRTSVVRTSVSGSRVTLTPGDAGTATVTVTATDPGGLSATQRFTVTVTASGSTGDCSIESLGTLQGTTPRTRSGSLGRDCESPNQSGKLARYYSFRVSETSEVRIDLESSAFDPLLFLRQGSSLSGRQIERDDDGGSGRNARIERELSAGTYTIEATSFRSATTGAFTLRVARTEGGGTSTPSGQAVEFVGDLDCSVTEQIPGSGFFSGTVSGRVRAVRSVSFVRVTGMFTERDGGRRVHSLFPDSLGSMSAGETESFSSSGVFNSSATRVQCSANAEWTEIRQAGQGSVRKVGPTSIPRSPPN